MHARLLLPLVLALALAMTACAGTGDERARVVTVTQVPSPPPTAAPNPPSVPPVEVSPTPTPVVTEAPDAGGAMVLVMDASGSMNEQDAQGRPLIDSAKEALRGLVQALPDGLDVGLRVYGHRVPNTDRVNGCQDTELVVPVAPLDREGMLAAIDSYQALGFTPIGVSLQAAAADLPPEGPRTIVLVSDGEDTCAPPDPCEIAAGIRADGIDLVIETVGFALGGDEVARQQLQCIAEQGGGEFRDVADAEGLTAALQDVTDRASRRFQAAGAELQGAAIPREAPLGQVGVDHLDTIAGGESLFYRFQIPAGSTVQAEAILEGDPSVSEELLCPEVFLTDNVNDEYAYSSETGDYADQTFIRATDATEIEANEVWVRVDAAGCSSTTPAPGTFPLQVRLSVVG